MSIRAFPGRLHSASRSRSRFSVRRRVMSAKRLHTKLGRAANLRRSRITKRQQGFTFVHPLGLSLACGFPLGVGRSWAFPSLLHTPPLPATHGEVGTGIGHLPERSLSSAPLMRSDRVSHRYFPVRQWAPFDPSMAEIRQLACILQYIYILIAMKLCSRWPAISPPGMIGDGDDWHGR